ncbi:glycosyltransferase family 4 protein [Candidatus Pelagibacter sp. HIMB1542]|uniref:glycosyltransferase family 4 protein n=1 Tax=Candidatus Pelagibacter sp. HIMB1542 TaxID=3413346 RepID=UPI003F857D51
MKISVLLPYKENFSPDYAGAVSIFLKDTIKISKYRKYITVYGHTNLKKKLLSNYKNINFTKFFFRSSSKIYINKFLENEKNKKSTFIEIHNRPAYIKLLYKINKNLVLYFHNNPLEMKSSKSVNERIEILKKTKKIIFNSKWTLNKFKSGLDKKYYRKKLEVINPSTLKKKINFKNKKKIILFVGRLNKSKGYDIFGKAIIRILNKYTEWIGVVIGDEPREKYIFNHERLKLLSFQKHNVVSKWFEKSDIAITCSRWEEPFGRVALEASSAGCAVLISHRGGLPEASPKAIKIKNLNVKNLEIAIKKLIKNPNYKKSLQKKIYNHFFLTNTYTTKKIDNYRKELLSKLL